MTSPLPPTTTTPPATSPTTTPTPPASPPASPDKPSRPRRSDRPAGDGRPPPPLPPSRPRPRKKTAPPAPSADGAPGSATGPTTPTTSPSSASTDTGPDPYLDGPKPSGPRAEKLVSLDKVRAFVGDVVDTAAAEANTRANPQEIPDLWLADTDDHRDLDTPIARIIYRRLPAGTDELGNPDLGDAIEALIALWFYIRKQIGKLRDWRHAKRQLDAEMGDQTDG